MLPYTKNSYVKICWLAVICLKGFLLPHGAFDTKELVWQSRILNPNALKRALNPRDLSHTAAYALILTFSEDK